MLALDVLPPGMNHTGLPVLQAPMTAQEGRLCVERRSLCFEIGSGGPILHPHADVVVCADSYAGLPSDDKTGKSAIVLCRH